MHRSCSGCNTSYKVSKLIAKCGKAHTIGEQLILPALTEIMSSVFKLDTNNLRSVSLGNNTVWRRINEISDDIRRQLLLEIFSDEEEE